MLYGGGVVGDMGSGNIPFLQSNLVNDFKILVIEKNNFCMMCYASFLSFFLRTFLWRCHFIVGSTSGNVLRIACFTAGYEVGCVSEERMAMTQKMEESLDTAREHLL